MDLNLNFLLDNRYFEVESIKRMFNLYIDSLDIDGLINLNNGVYIKLPENLINASRMVDYDIKTEKSQIKVKNEKIENILRSGLKEYISNNIGNLDINLIWDIMSDIFKMNILIVEVSYENGVLKSAIRCPNVNKKTSILNRSFKNYCLLLKFKNTYQPLVFYKKTRDIFNMVFNVNSSSYDYLEQLFDKCLLKYNDNIYNNVLLNAVYNNIEIENFIVISDTDLGDLIDEEIGIKYVINMNMNNVGLLLSNEGIKDELCLEHCPIDENLRGKTKYKEIKYVDGTTYMAKFRNDGKNNWKQLCKNCAEWIDGQELSSRTKKKYDYHCARCFVRCFPNDPRCIKAYAHTKELKVKKWLMESGESFLGYCYSDFIHDQVMYTTHSKCYYKRRIDFRIQINNTILCIEVNEKQHKTKAYKEDEERRKNNIVESNTFNYVFILFNPDSFLDSNGKRRNPPIKNRFPRLKEEINKQIKKILNEENNKDTLLEEIKLFYDEFE